jgi:hypothetical protein
MSSNVYFRYRREEAGVQSGMLVVKDEMGIQSGWFGYQRRQGWLVWLRKQGHGRMKQSQMMKEKVTTQSSGGESHSKFPSHISWGSAVHLIAGSGGSLGHPLGVRHWSLMCPLGP